MSTVSRDTASNILEDMYAFNKLKRKKKGEEREVINLFDLQDRSTLVDFIKMYVPADKQEYFLNNIDAAMSTKFPVISKDFRPFRVTYNLHQEPRIESHELNQKYRLMNDKIREIRKKENTINELVETGYLNYLSQYRN